MAVMRTIRQWRSQIGRSQRERRDEPAHPHTSGRMRPFRLYQSDQRAARRPCGSEMAARPAKIAVPDAESVLPQRTQEADHRSLASSFASRQREIPVLADQQCHTRPSPNPGRKGHRREWHRGTGNSRIRNRRQETPADGRPELIRLPPPAAVCDSRNNASSVPLARTPN